MALKIMRLDKKEEPRAAEIAQDWRQWANDNSYIKTTAIPLQEGHMQITLEVWEHLFPGEDTYLFYHPEIPTTVDTEVLYILDDREKLNRIVSISQHMATDLMRRLQRINDMLHGSTETGNGEET